MTTKISLVQLSLYKEGKYYHLNRDTIALHNLSTCGYDLSPMKRGYKADFIPRFIGAMIITTGEIV